MVLVVCVFLVCGTVLALAALLRPRPVPPPEPQVVQLPPPVVPSILDERLLESVIVTMKTGTTFEGVLYVEDHGALVLAKAEHVRKNGEKVPADGEIVLLREDVDYIQRP